MVMFGEPERLMAPWNRPTDRGDDSSAKIEVPPLDCPMRVTYRVCTMTGLPNKGDTGLPNKGDR